MYSSGSSGRGPARFTRTVFPAITCSAPAASCTVKTLISNLHKTSEAFLAMWASFSLPAEVHQDNITEECNLVYSQGFLGLAPRFFRGLLLNSPHPRNLATEMFDHNPRKVLQGKPREGGHGQGRTSDLMAKQEPWHVREHSAMRGSSRPMLPAFRF